MGYQFKTKAIVLHEMPVGDYDKRLILLTKEKGKIVAFVKGARRSNNRMLASTQLFAYGDYVIAKGKSSFNVYQAELLEHFHRLRMNIEDLTYGMFLLEFVEFVSEEELENKALMKLLLYGLYAMEKQRVDTKLIVQIFLLKAMSIIGLTPWVNNCTECHKEEGINYFSPEVGGVLCSDHQHYTQDVIKVGDATVYTIRYILSKPVEEVFSFKLEETYLVELEHLVHQFIKYHINHQFKTLEFLKVL